MINDPAATQAGELEATRRMLQIADGTFSLSIAVCNSPALRDRIIQQFAPDQNNYCIARIATDTTDPYASVVEQLGEQRPAAVFVIDLERIIRSSAPEQPALASLNASRELWARRLRCPVVLWLPEYAATLLSIHARDFWRFCSHHFRFEDHAATQGAHPIQSDAGSANAVADLPLERKYERIAELEQRLADAGENPPIALREHYLVWIYELAWIYLRIGRLVEAERLFRKFNTLAAQSSDLNSHTAAAYSSLGNIMRTRGDLVEAERLHRKALEINENLGQLEGMASDYCNLGNIMQTRGDLDEAERMHRKSLEIDEKLGNLEGMAIQYGNLGGILQTRGDLFEAERMYYKALGIFEKIGHQEQIARTYGNLGVTTQIRGDLDQAERMHRKSLEIDENLGNLEGMAFAYANLGGIAAQRGDIPRARELWTTARDLFAKLGAKPMVERIQGWLDELPE